MGTVLVLWFIELVTLIEQKCLIPRAFASSLFHFQSVCMVFMLRHWMRQSCLHFKSAGPITQLSALFIKEAKIVLVLLEQSTRYDLALHWCWRQFFWLLKLASTYLSTVKNFLWGLWSLTRFIILRMLCQIWQNMNSLCEKVSHLSLNVPMTKECQGILALSKFIQTSSQSRQNWQ